MKKILLGLWLVASVMLLQDALAQKIPTMEFYHGATCPHCHSAKAWFPELLEAYPDLQIQEYEVWNDANNQKKFRERMAQLGEDAGAVPTMIIDDNVIIGFNPQKVLQTMEGVYGPPATEIKPQNSQEEKASLWQKIVNFFKNLFS